MKVSAWKSGKSEIVGSTYGVRVGIGNRNRHFQDQWIDIDVEMDGQSYNFTLTTGFWKKCPEFRDSGQTTIRDWLIRHKSLAWKKGEPPQMTLEPLGEGRFKLIP